MGSIAPSSLLAPAVTDLCLLLRDHLAGAAGLTEHEMARAASLFTPRHLEKGARLLAPGDICAVEGMVARGCLRVYASDPDGGEEVLYFAAEGWWVTDPESLLTAQPAALGIDAIEATDILLFNRAKLAALSPPSLLGDRLLRLVAENTLVRLHRRLAGRMRRTATQRYLDFRRLYPDLDLRIPQYHIASYLGVSAEFLCRLRARCRRRSS